MNKKTVDYRLFFVVLLLIIFWMIMISSVSVYSSFRVTDLMFKKWLITEAYNHFYVLRNMAHVTISLIVLAIVSKIHYKFFEKYAKHIFLFIIVLLIIVLLIWLNLKWAKWWISIPGIPFTIQPTEFLKFSMIIFLATFFKKYKYYLSDFKGWFIPFISIVWIIVLLVWMQPDFWTIMVIIPVSVIMFFYSWANIKHLLLTILLWFFLIFSVYLIWDYDKKTRVNTNKFWYITQRIDSFLQKSEDIFKWENLKNERLDQTRQALITIWSWWFTGLWFGQSIQKFWYLPEVQWDFIFSVIIEELWFIWWLIVISLYMFIWYRWFYIASRIGDTFPSLVAIWISSWILIQAFINIWVNLNIIPLTWITLPFISYWWSSLLSLLIALWVLLNISRYIEKKSDFSRVNRKKIMF
jgi:cell division protein FtsW